jgi:hypothetical protein
VGKRKNVRRAMRLLYCFGNQAYVPGDRFFPNSLSMKPAAYTLMTAMDNSHG